MTLKHLAYQPRLPSQARLHSTWCCGSICCTAECPVSTLARLSLRTKLPLAAGQSARQHVASAATWCPCCVDAVPALRSSAGEERAESGVPFLCRPGLRWPQLMSSSSTPTTWFMLRPLDTLERPHPACEPACLLACCMHLLRVLLAFAILFICSAGLCARKDAPLDHSLVQGGVQT